MSNIVTPAPATVNPIWLLMALACAIMATMAIIVLISLPGGWLIDPSTPNSAGVAALLLLLAGLFGTVAHQCYDIALEE